MNANNRQVGGSHYQSKVQHWDLMCRNDVPYLQASATKYVVRWRKRPKDKGIEDLEKCLHYIEKIHDEYMDGRIFPGSGIPMCLIVKFFDANPDIESKEQAVLVDLLRTWNEVNLEHAGRMVTELMKEAKNATKK